MSSRRSGNRRPAASVLAFTSTTNKTNPSPSKGNWLSMAMTTRTRSMGRNEFRIASSCLIRRSSSSTTVNRRSARPTASGCRGMGLMGPVATSVWCLFSPRPRARSSSDHKRSTCSPPGPRKDEASIIRSRPRHGAPCQPFSRHRMSRQAARLQAMLNPRLVRIAEVAR
jgi:hypothetical protein